MNDEQVGMSGSRGHTFSVWSGVLGVSAVASADEACGEFLRGLAGAGFVPSSLAVGALNACCGTSAALERDEEVRVREREELRAFAGAYWSLPPGVRRECWSSLCVRLGDSVYLRELERGLDVEVTQLENADANELACLFRELFVLPRRERAIRRVKWLAEQANSQDRWRIGLVLVQHSMPKILNLDTELARCLRLSIDIKIFTNVDYSAPRENQTYTQSAELVKNADQPKSQVLVRRAAVSTPPDYKIDRGHAVFLLVAFVLSIGFLVYHASNFGFQTTSFEGSNQQPSPKTFQEVLDSVSRNSGQPEWKDDRSTPLIIRTSPKVTQPVVPPPIRLIYSQAEWYAFLTYESDRSTKQPAPGYEDWIRAGRPLPTPEGVRP